MLNGHLAPLKKQQTDVRCVQRAAMGVTVVLISNNLFVFLLSQITYTSFIYYNLGKNINLKQLDILRSTL